MKDMSNRQIAWTETELLATDAIAEPLLANGRRCHGGFNAQGEYVSPRTAGRWPAIRQWQRAHEEQSGRTILDAPLDQWPKPFPSVSQTKFLLRNGITLPTAAMLTRIGTVEGFGGLIREVGIGDLQPHFDDSIANTALSHLETGLFEAHARDEVGFENEAGHKEMWFAARDIAFDHAYSQDETSAMLLRAGFGAPAASGEVGAAPAPPARLVHEIDGGLESMLRFMIGLMFIEVSAFHTFAWAEAVLSDSELVAGDGEAALLVQYIRSDEAPHIAYLQTALTETRDRTMTTIDGGTIAGSVVIQRLWDSALADSLGPRREAFRQSNIDEVRFAVRHRTDGEDLLREFLSLSEAPTA